jgi:hypothetical protein
MKSQPRGESGGGGVTAMSEDQQDHGWVAIISVVEGALLTH